MAREVPFNDETHAKLLEAAGEVFAEKGFHGSTIREICNLAGTNVASVNYHFGDKLALYAEVLKIAVNAAETGAWRAQDDSVPPEESLKMFIRFMFRNFQRPDKLGWHLKLLMHEMAHPTPAFADVINEVIRPNFRKLSGIVSRITGFPANDDRTRMCVFSIMGQIIFYVHGRIVLGGLWPEMKMNEERMEQISSHIVEFTLCSLRALPKESTRSRKHK